MVLQKISHRIVLCEIKNKEKMVETPVKIPGPALGDTNVVHSNLRI